MARIWRFESDFMKTQIEKLSKPIVEKVAIVGAGLGGLATAIALRKQGFDAHVYEKAQEFRPAGLVSVLLQTA